MFHSYANSVKEHKNNDKPIKPLCFDCMTYPKAESFFGSPKTFTLSLRFHFRFQISCKIENIFRFADSHFVSKIYFLLSPPIHGLLTCKFNYETKQLKSVSDNGGWWFCLYIEYTKALKLIAANYKRSLQTFRTNKPNIRNGLHRIEV